MVSNLKLCPDWNKPNNIFTWGSPLSILNSYGFSWEDFKPDHSLEKLTSSKLIVDKSATNLFLLL